MAKTPDTKTPAPRISVLDRRLNDPFGEPSVPIRLKDLTKVCRWFNGAISTDKIWRAKHVKGWDTVTPDMVIDMDQIGGHSIAPAGYITRGERGQEVLMCMPRDAYDQIASAKARKNVEHMGNPHAVKQSVVAAAGETLGDEAADFLNRRVGVVGGVRDSFERIEKSVE